jgi:hypothetical protein
MSISLFIIINLNGTNHSPCSSVLSVLVPQLHDWWFAEWYTTLHREGSLHVPLYFVSPVYGYIALEGVSKTHDQ